MLIEILSALPAGILFATVMSITPGPNNMMLLASGVNFGFRRTVPHLFGISSGVALLTLSVGFGLGEALQRFPRLYTVLEVASVLYLLYLAWKIGTSGGIQTKKGERRPMRFLEALAFQWVNPKAWMMVLTAVTTIRLSTDFNVNTVLMAAVFYLAGLPCICLWAGFGTAMRRLLSRPVWLRTFNIAMALALIVTVYPMARQMLG
ncbi:LysE family translocator [Robbsia sp. Bb-Pol-6]|uniref:LysE family translocator n=1 Tax=Robbsia betulipollinis TaxID=2981849 RepID=A0ABT3ZJL8_9BURK|nr:LysE family translocator [Robbsia betulipollinis]MCY0386178.1 LysE family translocator [Robbsia betulipollinis]